MTLDVFFKQNPRAALAFSGGCDSAYLLWAAKFYGCDLHAYFVNSAFQPQFELDDAQRLAKELDMPLTILKADVLSHPEVAKNGPKRCYHCKKVLFETIISAAMADGYPVVMDGTNASDEADDRPGMRALAELRVLSPLRECGITKPEVRAFSQKAGLFTYNKPAYACLATRVPTDTPLTKELLWRIEGAERELFSLGYSDFRVRVRSDLALLQFPAEQQEQAFSQRGRIQDRLASYFTQLAIDLAPRG